jgi:hypothetical protein
MKITDLLKDHADRLEFQRSVLDVIKNAIDMSVISNNKLAGTINTGQANKSHRDNKMSSPVRKKPALVPVTPKQIPPIPLYPVPDKRSW